MKRKIRLSESEFVNLVRKVLSEQVVQGKGSDPYEYKKEGDKYFARKKGTSNWIETTGNISTAIASKIFKITTTTPENQQTTDLPFKTASEGNQFREWVNNSHPDYDKSIGLDRQGSHTNSYIQKAWLKYGKEYPSKKTEVQKKEPQQIVVMPGINPKYSKQIDWKKLSTTDSTEKVCTSDTPECAQFLNNWDNRISSVGNAWIAYRNDSVMGPTVYSSFKGLNQSTVKEVISLWQQIHKKGGGVKNGPYTTQIYNIVDKLVPKAGQYSKLKPGDYVGLFYPESTHHEEAFYQGGEPWFVDGDPDKPGKNIMSGNGWGMNTHIGIVAAIKNGVPLIFHNIGGNVISDPVNKLRIAWVKRPA